MRSPLADLAHGVARGVDAPVQAAPRHLLGDEVSDGRFLAGRAIGNECIVQKLLV
jgi:hypothetical protein